MTNTDLSPLIFQRVSLLLSLESLGLGPQQFVFLLLHIFAHLHKLHSITFRQSLPHNTQSILFLGLVKSRQTLAETVQTPLASL